MSNLNIVKCTPGEAKDIVRVVLGMDPRERPTVMLHGTPGVGKTSIVWQLCRELFDNEPIVVHASMHEPADVKGLPDLDRERDVVRWLKPDFLPRRGEGILFLDDITSARRDMMAALYAVTLDRRIDDLEIAPGYAIVCAGNDVADGAISNPLGTAMADRMLHVLVETSPESFVAHWAPLGMHPAILALVTQMPHVFMDNERRIEEDLMCSPTPRAWERAWHLLKRFEAVHEGAGEVGRTGATRSTRALGAVRRARAGEAGKAARHQLRAVLSGCLGMEAADHLMLTMEDVDECVDPRELLAMDMAKVATNLPRTLRAGIALAFSLAKVCEGVPQIARGCAIMALVAKARARGGLADPVGKDQGVLMTDRELAAFGMEKLLGKAEAAGVVEEVLAHGGEGSDELRAYLEDVAERYDSIEGRASA